jgi:hypothetical protein
MVVSQPGDGGRHLKVMFRFLVGSMPFVGHVTP